MQSSFFGEHELLSQTEIKKKKTIVTKFVLFSFCRTVSFHNVDEDDIDSSSYVSRTRPQQRENETVKNIVGAITVVY